MMADSLSEAFFQPLHEDHFAKFLPVFDCK